MHPLAVNRHGPALKNKISHGSGGTGRSVSKRVTKLICVLLLFPILLWSSAAYAEVSLVFGVYTSDKPSAMVRQFRPSLNVIAKRAGEILGEDVKIRMQVVRSYDDGVKLIVSGSVDFVRLGPASYVTAKAQNPAIEILAMEHKNGAKSFNGIIAVRTDSNITDVRQLKGRTFAFGSKRSTIGRYLAQLQLARAGVFARDLKRYEYLGRHDKVGAAVGAGLFDAGALKENTFAKLVAKGVLIRAIAKMRNMTKPWVARADLEPRLKQALRQALLGLDDPAALAALRFDGFLPGNDSDYEPTRRAIEENPRFFAQLQ